jgi:hypothetical protein
MFQERRSMIYGIDYETRTIGGLKRTEAEKPEELHCGACDRKVESLSRCVWDDRLVVGPCCEVYTEHLCPACGSENLEFGDAAVQCLDCGCATTEAACQLEIGPFELTSPAEMPRLEAIRVRPVKVTALEFRKSGAA